MIDQMTIIDTTSADMKLKPEKNSGLNGIRTRDLCDIGAVFYQLRYQAKQLNTQLTAYFSCVDNCDDQS